jgi:hypothetical protein
MKHLTMNSLMAAAVVVLAAGSASAQTLKADIPFTFQVGSVTMAPGAYTVSRTQGAASRYLRLRNDDTKKAILAQYSVEDVSKNLKSQGTAVLQFECAGPRCVLREAWAGTDSQSYRFYAPKLAHDGDTRIAEVRMTAAKAD